MNGTIYFRADHDLIGRVIAEKQRRRMADHAGEGFRVDHSAEIAEREDLLARRVTASGRVA